MSVPTNFAATPSLIDPIPSVVLATPTAPAEIAMAHFAAKLAVETDCSDVFTALSTGAADFILLDVRAEKAFLQQHVRGAQNLPHRQITATRLAAFPPDKTFVVYCAGPHCNGADQAAYKIASLGYSVKLMIGGITGWADEGLPFTSGEDVGADKEAALQASCAC